jgi:primase-polymerase (primpol)-like protein
MTAVGPAQITDFRVPDDLAERDQWVIWRYETRQDKPTKVPYHVSGRLANTTDPRTWATFERARNVWLSNRQSYAGVGFAFAQGDGLAGIDLDDSLDEQGDVKAWTRGIVERFNDSAQARRRRPGTASRTSGGGHGARSPERRLHPRRA